MAVPEQSPLEYLLVLDFEATCERDVRIKNPEIIEWPCVVLEVQSRKTVDPAQPIANVLKDFCGFVEADKRLIIHPDGGANFAVVTCGDWDLNTALKHECRRKQLPLPLYLKQWVNIKWVFDRTTGTKAKGMDSMLRHLGLKLDGRHHSGIDDTHNITKVAQTLLDMGAVFNITGRCLLGAHGP